MYAERDCSGHLGYGVKLRRINADNQAKMQARLRELAKRKGWSEAETEDKGLDLLEDDETRVQDETASHLLGLIDKLGQSADGAPPCSQIEELKAVAAQLLEVTGSKAAHISAKLDNELKSARTSVASQTPAPEPRKRRRPRRQRHHLYRRLLRRRRPPVARLFRSRLRKRRLSRWSSRPMPTCRRHHRQCR